MMAPHAGLERRVLAALDATPPRIPVVIGGCGSGRTTLLHALNDRLGRDRCQYVDVERAASTPERFHQAFAASSPFTLDGQSAAAPRDTASTESVIPDTIRCSTMSAATGSFRRRLESAHCREDRTGSG